jgi:hypothetical protein
MDPENYWGFGAISNTCPNTPKQWPLLILSSINIHRGCTLQDDAQQKKKKIIK